MADLTDDQRQVLARAVDWLAGTAHNLRVLTSELDPDFEEIAMDHGEAVETASMMQSISDDLRRVFDLEVPRG